MILVDSSVWIDYFNGVESWQTNTLDMLLSEQLLYVGDIILTEVLQGFVNDHDFQTASDMLGELPHLQVSNREIAYLSAQNYRRLRSKGVTVGKTIDLLIATCCISNSVALLHSDKDFDLIANHIPLRVFAKS